MTTTIPTTKKVCMNNINITLHLGSATTRVSLRGLATTKRTIATPKIIAIGQPVLTVYQPKFDLKKPMSEKRYWLAHHLNDGKVMIVFDATQENVIVPQHLRNTLNCKFNIYPKQLVNGVDSLTEESLTIECTFKSAKAIFSTPTHTVPDSMVCVIPLSSIFALIPYKDKGQTLDIENSNAFDEDFPQGLLDAFAQIDARVLDLASNSNEITFPSKV